MVSGCRPPPKIALLAAPLDINIHMPWYGNVGLSCITARYFQCGISPNTRPFRMRISDSRDAESPLAVPTNTTSRTTLDKPSVYPTASKPLPPPGSPGPGPLCRPPRPQASRLLQHPWSSGWRIGVVGCAGRGAGEPGPASGVAASGTQRGLRRGGRPPAPKAASEPACGALK